MFFCNFCLFFFFLGTNIHIIILTLRVADLNLEPNESWILRDGGEKGRGRVFRVDGLIWVSGIDFLLPTWTLRFLKLKIDGKLSERNSKELKHRTGESKN